jgi:large subunit ribosomal protein L21
LWSFEKTEEFKFSTMYAIVEIGGHQYRVSKDDVLFVDKQNSDKKSLTFDKVLLVKDDKGAVSVGTPTVEGYTVSATLLEDVKADKIIVFKKKRRKGYRVKNGHRQQLSQIKIDKIAAKAKKAAPKKAETKAPKADTKEETKDA